jgi:hypothetical protein
MKIEVSVRTDLVGSKVSRVIEIDDADLEGLDQDERDQRIEEIAKETAFDMFQWNWEPAETTS